MKTLGLVGGTGWVSRLDYYRLINQGINRELGGHEFARLVLYSINFADIVAGNEKGDTESIFFLIKDATEKVIRSGAEGIVLCANTLHKFVDRLKTEINVQIIHIARAVAREINIRNLSIVGLMGTKHTMEGDFYISELANISTIVPIAADMECLNATIYDELLLEIFNEKSRRELIEIMKRLKLKGAEGIVLGCTELPLIVHDNDFELPLFNTTAIHADAAVAFALDEGLCQE
jgi:aspartate racemase